ncbi:RES domain-containing protein [Pseudomonas sp. GW101-3H06]|uniref:RES domain-containing protein n=1 Tax=Pseudomonas sp. GW101-3H06 TaxID=2751347 RepID=UPI001A919CC5|nr:RES domain-containing protein [Pseudomonas sp. GW101-3H06]
MQKQIGVEAAGECSYCDEINAPRIDVEELAIWVEEAFEGHYERTAEEPTAFEYAMHRDSEIDYDWEREGDPVLDVISDIVGCEESIASDVLEILNEKHDHRDPSDPYDECEFAFDSYYRRKKASSGDWDELWFRLEHALKHESRLFNQEALTILNSVFAGLDKTRSRTKGLALVTAGPGKNISALYRAREFFSAKSLQSALVKPVEELGPPPGRLAKAGRMNSSGIAVFYGALEVGSALAEVRPVVGSNVVTAKFDIIRPINLLDLRALVGLRCEGSIFDPRYAKELERHDFLQTLSKRLVLPVMPNEQDHEYLITQAVADYLASLQKPNIDGIIFPSVQDGVGVNVVLFHKAARVESLGFPPSTDFSAQVVDYDPDTGADYPWYTLQIDQPADPTENADFIFPFPNTYDWSQVHAKHREPCLKLDLQTLQVHAIKAVEVKAKAQNVMVRVDVARPNVKSPFSDNDF